MFVLRALFAAAVVLLAFAVRPASADVVSCGANLALFSSPTPCNGVTGPVVTVDTPSVQAPGVAFDISGHYYNSSAPTGIKFCDATTTGCAAGSGTALSSPTIGGNAWASTAADVTIAVAGTYYLCVAEVPSTTVTGCSAAFVVIAPAITIDTPGTKTASVGFNIFGTYSNTKPTGIEFRVDSGSYTALSAPTISDVSPVTGMGTWASTASDVVIASAGSHTVGVREQPSTSITATSGSFSVTGGGGGCSNSLDFSDPCNSQYLGVI